MIVNMANEFVRRNHNVTILVVQNVGPYAENVDKGVQVVDLNKDRTALTLPALRQYLAANNPDIFLSALFHVNILAMLAKIFTFGLKTKFIVTERNQLSLRTRNSEHKRDRLVPFLVFLLYRFADKVIGISKGVAGDVRQTAKLNEEKIGWIHNPVVSAQVLDQLEQNTDDPWFDESDDPVIVTSGRLVPQKDYETFFLAFKKLLESKKARLLILGDGALKDELTQRTEQLGITDHVCFKGFVDSPLPYMKRAQLFAITSRWEGFCNVIVEALLCGLPIVSTDCPSGPAEILEDGKFGALCPVGDMDALAKAMEEALEKPIDPEIQKKRAMDFTVQKICDQYEALMEEVVA